jgi:predicted membrane-bound spermidine synthase
VRSRIYLVFFLISGFCSLVDETVWLRLSMAAFGVTTASVSIVVSVFMAGLALGSWLAGRIVERDRVTPGRALRWYALCELVIGCSGLFVPLELAASQRVVERLALSSAAHYGVSGLLATVALLPWCLCMGATFPLAMAAIRATRPSFATSFSYLYIANVIGASGGTLASAYVLIELLGFRHTLATVAALNVLLAIAAFAQSRGLVATVVPAAPAEAPRLLDFSDRGVLALVFGTGFVSMALEVVWIRQYTPFLGTVVYAFARILACYLIATFVGSAVYRSFARVRSLDRAGALCSVAAGLGLLALLATDPRLAWSRWSRVVAGIAPLSAMFGFLTPMLVDRFAAGGPRRAGRAYAMNALGCVAGPLAAGFLFLPRLGERWTTAILIAPFLTVGVLTARRLRDWATAAAMAAAAIPLIGWTYGFEEIFPHAQIRRDHTATVIATGQGMHKRLLVNGISMTSLTPITKMMAHLPLSARATPPRAGLIICFGMGTSFRSMRSWGVDTTAVELVPSVPATFGYFHPDGPALLREPGAQVIVDDGRRFLARTGGRYDVILVDPPPPVQAASSSLLYSRQFYELAKTRLREGGIVAQWLPGGDPTTIAGVARALVQSFREVRVLPSVEQWGFHFLASDQPLPKLDAAEMAARLPARARADLVEWGPHANAQEQLRAVVDHELSLGALRANDESVPAVEDDRPLNEYDWLRRHAK